MATKSQQKEWLALFEDEEQTAPTGWYLKKWLLGGEQIPTTAALFDLAEYKGEIVTDLFGEEGYFGDVQAFWVLQNAAIESRKASYLEQGWKHDAYEKNREGKIFPIGSAARNRAITTLRCFREHSPRRQRAAQPSAARLSGHTSS